MLLPFMHSNIAQISRTWVAKIITSNLFDPAPFQPLIQSVPSHLTPSLRQPSSPNVLIVWNPPETILTSSSSLTYVQKEGSALVDHQPPVNGPIPRPP
jgi:hypothetical protein